MTTSQHINLVSAMSDHWDRAAEALKARDYTRCDQHLAEFKAIDRELRKRGERK